jgi:hypothetical protein
MKKIFLSFITLILTIPLQLFASTQTEEIRLMARIKNKGSQIQLVRDNQSAGVKTVLGSPDLQKVIDDFEPGDEALITGHLKYQIKGVEAESTPPVFIISSIKPVSLKRLGIQEKTFVEDPKAFLISPSPAPAPKTITVTKEVATAITMTASLLMLQDLTAKAGEPGVKKDINTGLIFSAGALATGLFIYEQITGKTKPK